MASAISERYPLSHQLEDGARTNFSLMSLEHREDLSKFVDRLSSHDLLYLQVDIRQPDVLDRWFDAIQTSRSVCICAHDPARMIGYASVHMSDDGRDGEIRVNIDRGYRSRGLGKALISEIYFVANQMDLESVTARMTSDQHGAISAFTRLGFVEKDVLVDRVTDQDGRSKDLIIMSFNMLT